VIGTLKGDVSLRVLVMILRQGGTHMPLSHSSAPVPHAVPLTTFVNAVSVAAGMQA
jgi:hypothetical protein